MALANLYHRDLFYALADRNYNSTTYSPYNPAPANASTPSEEVLASLTSYDVYAQFSFAPTSATVNGAFPINSTWHTGNNTLGADSTTGAFIAKDHGPKFLSSTRAGYQIIQPLVTPTQSEGNFTLSTITAAMGALSDSALNIFESHTALQVLEGKLTISLERETVELLGGDTAFVPAGTPFRYWSEIAFTKFLHVCGGARGLDTRLIEDSVPWGYPVWPTS